MAIRIVRLGSPRAANEGPRLGTVRRPPRGVKKSEYSTRDFYDAWLPELAPSAELIAWAMEGDFTAARWTTFSRRYRSEMRQPGPQRLIAVFAALSRTSDFSVGCYCENESRCHRSLLRQLLADAGATVVR